MKQMFSFSKKKSTCNEFCLKKSAAKHAMNTDKDSGKCIEILDANGIETCQMVAVDHPEGLPLHPNEVLCQVASFSKAKHPISTCALLDVGLGGHQNYPCNCLKQGFTVNNVVTRSHIT